MLISRLALRYLANKCSIASRIDCFSEAVTSAFGTELRDQVEERLKFFETGDVPRKNIDVMKAVMAKVALENAEAGTPARMLCTRVPSHCCSSDSSKPAKRKAEHDDEPKSDKKKKKKSKEAEPEAEAAVEVEETPVADDGAEKKKKKKKSKDE